MYFRSSYLPVYSYHLGQAIRRQEDTDLPVFSPSDNLPLCTKTECRPGGFILCLNSDRGSFLIDCFLALNGATCKTNDKIGNKSACFAGNGTQITGTF